MTWADLPRRARIWRLAHAAWSIAQLLALAEIWDAVLSRRRSPRAWAGAAFLGVEGAGLLVGRGNCPVGRWQEAAGDPVPFFELVLPPRAAKAAVPILAAISATAIAGLVLRRPGVRWRASAAESRVRTRQGRDMTV